MATIIDDALLYSNTNRGFAIDLDHHHFRREFDCCYLVKG